MGRSVQRVCRVLATTSTRGCTVHSATGGAQCTRTCSLCALSGMWCDAALHLGCGWCSWAAGLSCFWYSDRWRQHIAGRGGGWGASHLCSSALPRSTTCGPGSSGASGPPGAPASASYAASAAATSALTCGSTAVLKMSAGGGPCQGGPDLPTTLPPGDHREPPHAQGPKHSLLAPERWSAAGRRSAASRGWRWRTPRPPPWAGGPPGAGAAPGS